MEEGPERRLAVLLHADVAESTTLVQANETLAHLRIRDAFRSLSESITSHGGATREIRGDALVAEFSKGSDAIAAALDFQTANAAHSREYPDEIRPVLRIGIAMGEVVVADGTVTGEGVVLAQRLEQLAEPGGISLQGAVYETIPKRLPFSYEDLGERPLKGFDVPVRAYAVRLDARGADPRPESSHPPPSLPADKPWIVVLPFDNLSNDPEQEYFRSGARRDRDFREAALREARERRHDPASYRSRARQGSHRRDERTGRPRASGQWSTQGGGIARSTSPGSGPVVDRAVPGSDLGSDLDHRIFPSGRWAPRKVESGQAIPHLPVKPMSDIESWLERHGLHEFAGVFRAEQIRLADLPTLTDEDLKELGLPMGPRRRLLRAAAEIGKAPDPQEDVPAAEEPSALTGQAERRQLSVLFCDLVGSVELGERMDVEDYRDLLARFRMAVQGAIAQFDGFVARHQGDGLLAYFGYPQAHENDAERAVRAALRVIADVRAIRHPYPVTLEVRVGIATGPVIVGDVLATGASRRSELAALGPTPNLAARLQAMAAPNTIVISTTTGRLVEHFFSLRRLAPQALKGIAAPVHSYVVQGALDPETGSAALDSSAGLNPFVGRQGELRLMLERWKQVKEGSGQGVLISAEPGVGKTRLVRELREALAPPDYASIVLFCSPYHGGTTLYPVIEAINRRLGSQGDDTDVSRIERLESWLGELGLDPGVHLPTIASLLSLPPSTKYPSLDANPDVRRDLLLRSLRQLVEKLAERQPVLLVAEDLHWADASTIELLGLLLDDARSRPILALLTFRPEFEPPWKRLSNLTSLTLNNLTDVECRTLARQVFGQGSTNESVLEQVVARADGVPLFAEELARAVLESSSGGETRGSIPETLRDALTARLDRLGRVKEVAQLAAIIGREFSLFFLMHLSGLEEASLRTALDALVASGLIYPRGSGDRYEFKHALVQEAAYGSLLRERRQACHRQLAEILEQHAPDVGENQPELLARHYEEGGVMESALDYWHRAGRRAGEQSAHSESVDHLRRALALLGDLPATPERRELALELNILLGAALQMVVGQTSTEVETTYQRARTLAAEVQHPERSWPVVFGLWRWHVTNGDRSTAERIERELSALSREVEDPDLACSAALASGITAFYTGRFVKAWEHLGPVLENSHFLMLRVGMPVEASASVYRALTLWQLGFQEQALQWVALKSDRPYQRMIVLHFAALLHSFAQDVDKVRECAEEGHKLAREQGFSWFFNMGMFLRGWALACDGELEAGVSMMEEYVQRYPEERRPPRMSHVFSMLSEAYELNGQVSEALRANRTAREIAERGGWLFWYAEILRREGELLLRASDADAEEARALFEKALGTARAQGSRSLTLRAAVSIARLHRDRGRRSDAIDVLSPVYGQFTEGFAGKDLSEARQLLAELG